MRGVTTPNTGKHAVSGASAGMRPTPCASAKSKGSAAQPEPHNHVVRGLTGEIPGNANACHSV